MRVLNAAISRYSKNKTTQSKESEARHLLQHSDDDTFLRSVPKLNQYKSLRTDITARLQRIEKAQKERYVNLAINLCNSNRLNVQDMHEWQTTTLKESSIFKQECPGVELGGRTGKSEEARSKAGTA